MIPEHHSFDEKFSFDDSRSLDPRVKDVLGGRHVARVRQPLHVRQEVGSAVRQVVLVRSEEVNQEV